MRILADAVQALSMIRESEGHWEIREVREQNQNEFSPISPISL
jgi:hypothetical protein